MKAFKKAAALLLMAVLLVSAVPLNGLAASSTQVYYNIDFSAAVLKSRVQQQVSSDCAVVSMATIESYMYGTTSSTDKMTVYKALVAKNKRNNYAYWSNCGYVAKTIDWNDVYYRLATGCPVIVHRPKTSTKSEHWAVVAGYKGSTTKLEKDKFIIVDVYHGSGKTDIMTSAQWRGSVAINRMAYRKNGIAITSLSGIRFAINHPDLAHKYGEGHGVYGYITSNENITSLKLAVTDVTTGQNIFTKSLTPNSKSYNMFNLDAEFTFAKYPVGKYFYQIQAKTATKEKYYTSYFEVLKSWPDTAPSFTYQFRFQFGEEYKTQTVAYGSKLTIPAETPTNGSKTFSGWYVVRQKDLAVYCTNGQWVDVVDYATGKVDAVAKVYQPNEVYGISTEWIKGAVTTESFTFAPMWNVECTHQKTVTDVFPATCVADGYRTVNCANCNAELSRAPIASTGHTPGEWQVITQVGLGVEGFSEQRCTACNDLLDWIIEPALLPDAAAGSYQFGDVNQNSKIDAADYALVKRAVLKTFTLNEEQTVLADVNGNGRVDASDYALIKRHCLKTYSIYE